jgi:3-dehydroquinate synthetase
MMNRHGVPGLLVDVSEDAKCMETVMEICGWLLEYGADKDALGLGVGGGITTDMVVFAASLYKR